MQVRRPSSATVPSAGAQRLILGQLCAHTRQPPLCWPHQRGDAEKGTLLNGSIYEFSKISKKKTVHVQHPLLKDGEEPEVTEGQLVGNLGSEYSRSWNRRQRGQQ